MSRVASRQSSQPSRGRTLPVSNRAGKQAAGVTRNGRTAQAGNRHSVPAAVEQFLQRNTGHPLAPEVRTQMERKLGADLSAVRVHHDRRAAESAESVGARAYAVGSDVVFNRGEFSTRGETRRRLLAHELAHVVQQARGGAPLEGGHCAAMEHSAQQAASPGGIGVQGASGVGLARQPKHLDRLLEPGQSHGPDELSFEFDGQTHTFEGEVREKWNKAWEAGESATLSEPVTLHQDEPLAVGQKGVKPSRKIQRATKPANRQWLLGITNIRKGTNRQVPIIPKEPSKGPVSVTEDPGALFSRDDLSEVTEYKELFDRVAKKFASRRDLKATKLKAAINREVRRMIRTSRLSAAQKIRAALKQMNWDETLKPKVAGQPAPSGAPKSARRSRGSSKSPKGGKAGAPSDKPTIKKGQSAAKKSSPAEKPRARGGKERGAAQKTPPSEAKGGAASEGMPARKAKGKPPRAGGGEAKKAARTAARKTPSESRPAGAGEKGPGDLAPQRATKPGHPEGSGAEKRAGEPAPTEKAPKKPGKAASEKTSRGAVERVKSAAQRSGAGKRASSGRGRGASKTPAQSTGKGKGTKGGAAPRSAASKAATPNKGPGSEPVKGPKTPLEKAPPQHAAPHTAKPAPGPHAQTPQAPVGQPHVAPHAPGAEAKPAPHTTTAEPHVTPSTAPHPAPAAKPTPPPAEVKASPEVKVEAPAAPSHMKPPEPHAPPAHVPPGHTPATPHGAVPHIPGAAHVPNVPTGALGKIKKVGKFVGPGIAVGAGLYNTYKDVTEGKQDVGEAIAGNTAQTAVNLTNIGGPADAVINMANLGLQLSGAPPEAKEAGNLLADVTPSTFGGNAAKQLARGAYNVAKGDSKAIDKQVEEINQGQAGAPLQGYSIWFTKVIPDLASGKDALQTFNEATKIMKGGRKEESLLEKAGNKLGDEAYQFINKDLPEAAEFAKKDWERTKASASESWGSAKKSAASAWNYVWGN